MDLSQLVDALGTIAGQGVTHHKGMAPTGAKLPYTVSRLMLLDVETGAISGDAIDWDQSFTVYCCAASSEASSNLAIAVIAALHGKRVADSVLSARLGYSGALTEGQYESQVTIQFYRGGIQ